MQKVDERLHAQPVQTIPSARSAPAVKRGLQRTRDEIETVRANNPIEQVIGRYVELRPSGRRLVGRCPFHEDRAPSLVVYPNNQSWFCFACDVGGDVFTFVKRIENVSFGEALRRLGSDTFDTRCTARTPAPASTRPVPQVFLEQDKPFELSEEHFTLLTAATEVYHAAIFTQSWVLEYLAKRKIDLDMIRRHRIGYATGDNLAKYFRFRGWDPEIANDLGLIGPRGEYFRQRIVIPEFRAGKAIYLVGRATQKYQKAKYLGLPGAPKPLYGAELIRGATDVFLVEGAIDWLTLVEWGYPTVALLGSHLKHEQISEIADAERIFITTDSDEPGRKSARQLAELLGKRARIVPPLPNAKDVNELAMRPRASEIFADLVRQVQTIAK
ncbi:MAG: toprim domain-containing protein [Chloroflexi bacterium]|nr:toprim domain-containing protein [Chloroflexota bacterium]